MNWHPVGDPAPGDRAVADAVELVVVPRTSDIGGFSVRRALPTALRRTVGPFVFFDQMGPAEFLIGQGLDVRPHPHIGLSTLTYLFEGEITHRDSLGTDVSIRPGDLNWMTAGRGIVHSERSAPETRQRPATLSGIQLWAALPARDEEQEPGFVHHGAEDIPLISGDGATVRIIAGSAFGASSPVRTSSPLVYADLALEAGASLPIDPMHEERALYTVSGTIEIAGDRFEAGQLLVLRPGDRITVHAAGGPARLMLIGGEPLDGPRHIWWNFVSSRKERIEEAKADWAAARFDPVPGDALEFIPLPASPPPPVRYP